MFPGVNFLQQTPTVPSLNMNDLLAIIGSQSPHPQSAQQYLLQQQYKFPMQNPLINTQFPQQTTPLINTQFPQQTSPLINTQFPQQTSPQTSPQTSKQKKNKKQNPTQQIQQIPQVQQLLPVQPLQHVKKVLQVQPVQQVHTLPAYASKNVGIPTSPPSQQPSTAIGIPSANPADFANLRDLALSPTNILNNHEKAVEQIRKILLTKPKTIQYLTRDFRGKYNYRRKYLLLFTQALNKKTDDMTVVCLSALNGWCIINTPAQFNDAEWNDILEKAGLKNITNVDTITNTYRQIFQDVQNYYKSLKKISKITFTDPCIFKKWQTHTHDNKISILDKEYPEEVFKFLQN